MIAIRRLINFFRVFSMTIKLYPEVSEQINQRLESFIKDPKARHKDITPSLGDILVYAIVSDKYTLEEVLNLYLEEQLDRQIFWIVEKIPELDHTNYTHKNKNIIVEENRSEVCFKTGLTGFHLTLIAFELAALFSRYGKLSSFDADVDSNFGCLPSQVENSFQQKIKSIKRVESFKVYFSLLGVDCLDTDALTQRLRQAVTNSYNKKYHGYHSNGLPYIGTQINTMLTKEPHAFSYYDENSETFTAADDPCWKKACLERFVKVRRFVERSYKPVTVPEIAAYCDDRAMLQGQ